MSAAQRAVLERMNAFHDSRECELAEAPVLYLEDGTEKPLPCVWAVCHVCNGNGTHVNPSIDCGGLSAADFEEDPDFAESYFRGDYDQPCNACGGRSTVRVVDFECLSPEDRAAYEEQIEDERNARAEAYYEARMGA